MHLSLNLIKSLVDIEGISPEEIANRLTMSTAETEGIEYINRHFETIVTAKLLEVEKHPDSDHLTIVKADTGDKTHTVVCGAPNHKAGDIVPLALEGTRFSEEFIIKKTKIRGQESCGMLCSAKELGLTEDHSGILILPADTPIGTPLSKLYSDWVDITIEIDNKSITHRPDLWGHYGFAREIAALFDKELKDPVDSSLEKSFGTEESLKVAIECPDVASRYCGLVVKNIKIAESPEWMKARLSAIGMRPINNIVDITNYVMAEIGEPMHAFSRAKLNGSDIVVRMAKEGEKLTTLDGSNHTLTADDIVIADKENPIALAGVMGGGNSEIDDDTTEIVLEAANFDAVHIRKTAHRLNIRTDAAMRFEKSLDPELCSRAIIRCYQLIKELNPEAAATTQIIDSYPKKNEKLSIDINCATIRKLLGEEIPDERIIKILTALEYDVINSDGELSIGVPSYRATKDIEINADIVEEVGRMYGYDNITPCPPFVPCTTPAHNYMRELERKIKSILSANAGLAEVYNYSFTGEEILKKVQLDTETQLRLRNPLSIEHDRLRTDMIPALIGNIEHNLKSYDNFGIYELGRVYLKEERLSKDLAKENFRVAGAIYRKDKDAIPFYEAKHAINELLSTLRVKKFHFKVIDNTETLPDYVHPGRAIDIFIEGAYAGRIFELSPVIQSKFDIEGRAALFDLDVDLVFKAAKRAISFTELSKYPDVHFEISVLADSKTYAEKIIQLIKKTNQKYISSVEVISVYEGEPIVAGKKSVSLKTTFNGIDHTLSGEEIDKLQNAIMDAVAKSDYEIR